MSTSRVLRIKNRQVAWEEDDLEQLLRSEFRTKENEPDLKPSAYLIIEETDDHGRASCLRAKAEHVASFNSPPPKHGRSDVDLAGLGIGEVVPVRGKTQFEFTRNAHVEVVLSSEQQLREL